MKPDDGSVYYQHSGKVPLASRLSYMARTRMFRLFTAIMMPSSTDEVLDIGVTSDNRFQESNYFEQFYPYKTRVTCVGTENGEHLEELFPGLRFIQIQPNRKLPFSDGQFDIVFSNAVVEHVGDSQAQHAFLAEACRVGKRIFITTPNRWFPVEHHTSVPLLHYFPKGIYRSIMRRTPLKFWSYEQNLNLLTRRQFLNLFPPECPVRVERAGIRLGLFSSNLVAYTTLGTNSARQAES